MQMVTLKRPVVVNALRPGGETYAIKAKALVGELHEPAGERLVMSAYRAISSDSSHPHELGIFRQSIDACMAQAKREDHDFEWARERYWAHENRDFLHVEIAESNIDGIADAS